jgi:hypothetical protein
MRISIVLALVSATFLWGGLVSSAWSAGALSDTIVVSPGSPTTEDSLKLTFRGLDHNCCVQFYNKKVTVSDSSIYLFESFDDSKSSACRCLVAGFSSQFVCEPLKAGRYKIFYSEDAYCPPGMACAAIALIIDKRQVGEVLIQPAAKSTSAAGNAKRHGQKSDLPVLSYSNAESKLFIRIAKDQCVTVTAYIINGEKTTQLSSKKFLPAGVHSFRMDKKRLNAGVAVIHVKGETFSEVKMINFGN